MHQFESLSKLKSYIRQQYASAEHDNMMMIPKEALVDFLCFLFGSKAFIQMLADDQSFLFRIIRQVAQHDLIIAFQKEQKNLAERYTFTSYHRVLTLRFGDYDDVALFKNAILMHDLYLLHELCHIGTLEMRPEQPGYAWQKKMTDNELVASFTSEALIYFHLPFIRSKTLTKSIWVDRFLTDEIALVPGMSNRQYYQQSPELFEVALFRHFMFDYYNPSPTPQQWMVAQYRDFNNAWCQVWRNVYSIVEQRANTFKQNRDGVSYIQWLKKNEPNFRRAAQQFITLLNDPVLLDTLISSPLFKHAIQNYLRGLRQGVMADAINVTANVSPSIALLERNLPLTPTVYSLFSPEIRACVEKVNQSPVSVILQDNNVERKQDEVDKLLLNRYVDWTREVVSGLDNYPFQYFTNGSSEGIKNTLCFLFSQPTTKKSLHVFEGEYEGAVAYATAINISVVKHPRPTTLAELEQLFKQANLNHSLWYISQPSGIDGNLWPMFASFIHLLEQHQGKTIVDLAYVGTVAKPYHLLLQSPAIVTVVGSFSKMGVYYERVGVCYSRFENPLLYGNKWFKNLHSILIGLEIMGQISVYALAKKYQLYQSALIQYINQTSGFALEPADSFLIANQREDIQFLQSSTPETKIFQRGDHLRFCLSAGLRAMLYAAGYQMNQPVNRQLSFFAHTGIAPMESQQPSLMAKL